MKKNLELSIFEAPLTDEVIGRLEAIKKNAFESQDSATYARVCESLGVTPEDPDLYELGQMNSEYISDLFTKSSKNFPKKKKSVNSDKYPTLIRTVKSKGINVENVYADIPSKKKILNEVLGYEALRGLKGEWVPFENAKDSRVGKTFLKIYNSARKENPNI